MNALGSNANEKCQPAAPKALIALARLLARQAAREVVEDAKASSKANQNTQQRARE